MAPILEGLKLMQLYGNFDIHGAFFKQNSGKAIQFGSLIPTHPEN